MRRSARFWRLKNIASVAFEHDWESKPDPHDLFRARIALNNNLVDHPRMGLPLKCNSTTRATNVFD